MASLSYGRVFCLESQKMDGTEYLKGIDRLSDIFFFIEPRSLNQVSLFFFQISI